MKTRMMSLFTLMLLCMALCTTALAEDAADVETCPSCGAPITSTSTEHEYYASNVCSIGPRFSDETGLTDDWFMFAPVDVSKEGSQTFDLIAGDMHKIGTVTVKVKSGNVTVKVSYVCDDIIVRDSFMTLFTDIDEVDSVDPSTWMATATAKRSVLHKK